jgi:superfamily II DNA/RNA helicase
VFNDRRSRVLIIAPTRELAIQIDKEFQSFSRGFGIYSTVCIGGVSIHGQIHKLGRGPNFVIGTPGRLLDLENQRKLNFNQYDSIVLDEVDRMLDMGFIHDVNEIISKLPTDRQSLFFSATLGSKVKGVMGDFIYNPVMISVKVTDTRANVHQDIIKLNGRNKANVLRELLDKEEVSKTLIFTRTKRGADSLHRDLSKVNFQATVLHGNKTQNQRQKSLEQFRQNRVNILIATDVASRGIDIDNISHVINYDLPESYEAYVHRIGRTGRADKKGIALTFVD